MVCGTLKSQECQGVVRILQTFQQGTFFFFLRWQPASLWNHVAWTQQNVTVPSTFYTVWSKATPQGWHTARPRLTLIMQERVPSSPPQVFHPKILFICPVTHATSDHNKHYMGLDIISRLFWNLTMQWYNTRRDPELNLCGFQLSDWLFKKAPQLLKVDRNKIREDTLIHLISPCILFHVSQVLKQLLMLRLS